MATWFKMYPADYLLDSKVDQLSLEMQGILIRLWCLCAKDHVISSDLKVLARRGGIPEKTLTKHWLSIAPFFEQTDSGLYSVRLAEELAKYEAIGERQRQAAVETNAKRRAKRDGERTLERDAKRGESESESEITLYPLAGERELLEIWPRGKRTNPDKIRKQLEMVLTTIDFETLLLAAQAYMADVQERNPMRPRTFAKRLDLWLAERGFEPFLTPDPPIEDLSTVRTLPDPLAPGAA